MEDRKSDRHAEAAAATQRSELRSRAHADRRGAAVKDEHVNGSSRSGAAAVASSSQPAAAVDASHKRGGGGVKRSGGGGGAAAAAGGADGDAQPQSKRARLDAPPLSPHSPSGGGSYSGGRDADGRRHGIGEWRCTDGRVYEGEWVDGRRGGFGVEWNAAGDVSACGRWADDELIESRPVPRIKVLKGSRLSQARCHLSGVFEGAFSLGRLLRIAFPAAKAAPSERMLLLPDGGHYVGDFNEEHQAHGQGTSYLADGSESASGAWRNGKQHGRGQLKLRCGACYEGDFVGGVRSGLGRCTWAGGSRNEGEWAADQRSGFGVEWDKNGKMVKCGRWAHDKLIKACNVPRSKVPIGAKLSAAVRAAPLHRTLLMPDGGQYVGDFNADWKPHGHGALHHEDGAQSICSDWRAGCMNGRGMISWSDGRCYQGDFEDAKYSGLGCWTAPHDSVYEGDFVAGEWSGLGIEWDKGGKVIRCGRWAANQLVESCAVPRSKVLIGKHLSAAGRLASLLLPDGAGGFCFGPLNAAIRLHGRGSLHRADHTEVVSGQWTDGRLFVSGEKDAEGRLHGEGAEWCPRGLYSGRFERARASPLERTLLLPDGGHFVGPFNEQIQVHGVGGVEYLADGSERARGQWRNGKLHGRGQLKLPSGACYKGNFADGLKIGLGSFVWADGSRYEGEWAADQRSGFGVEWDKDGKVVKCGRWAHDRLVESCVVPRSKIPVGTHLSAAGQSQWLHAQDRSLVVRGVWVNDALQPEGQQSGAGAAAAGGAGAAAGPAAAAAAAFSSDCLACRSSARDCLIDCPHFCLCMECAARLDKCPICRAPITRREQKKVIFS